MTNFIILLVVSFVGVFAHALKKQIKDDSFGAIKAYFASNVGSTILTLFVAGGSLVGAVGLDPALGKELIVMAFTIGFGANSAFNKMGS